MATITDAANTLVAAIAAILYPDGVDPDAPNSVAGMPVKVYVGWPVPHMLDSDLEAGVVNVSVFPRPGERITTRYLEQWVQTVAPDPTLTLDVVGQEITVGGTITAGQVVAVVIYGTSYNYAALANDTLETIAAALTELIVVDYPAAVSDEAVITLPDVAIIDDARVGAAGTAVRELRRQEKQVQMTVWAPTPDARQAVGDVLDVAFARRKFLTAPDGTSVSVAYNGGDLHDENQKVMIYRQDFMLTVEYGTTETEQQMQIVSPFAQGIRPRYVPASYSPEAQAIFDQWVVPPTPTEATALNTAIIALNVGNYLPRMDRLGVMKGAATQQQGMGVDWKVPTLGITLVGSASWTNADGFVGSTAAGSAGLTGFNPELDGVNFTLNSGSLGAYITKAATPKSFASILGCHDGAEFNYLFTNNSAVGNYRMNTSTTADSGLVAFPTGSWIVGQRESSTVVKLYKDGVDVTGISAANTEGAVNAEMYMGAGNIGGGVFSPTDVNLGVWWAGAEFTDVELAEIGAIFDTYFAALSV